MTLSSARVATPSAPMAATSKTRCAAASPTSKDAGVDAVWMNTMTKREEIEEACRRIPAPVIAPYYGPKPSPTFAEFQKLGVVGGVVSEPNHRQRPAIDLGSAARIQRTRSGGARRVEQESAGSPIRHGAAHSGSDPAGEEDHPARRRLHSQRTCSATTTRRSATTGIRNTT